MKFCHTPRIAWTALAAAGCVALPAQAATIDVGGDVVNGYQLDYPVLDQADAEALLATDTSSNADAMALSNTSSAGDGVAAHLYLKGSNFLHPGDVDQIGEDAGGVRDPSYDGDTKTLIYHFEPDSGIRITGATVDHNLFVNPDGSFDGTVTSSWSTDNVNYTQISSITGDDNDRFDNDLADTGFTEGTDLYLKYELARDEDSQFPQRTQVFRTSFDDNGDPGFEAYDGFQVDLELGVIPEPASLALLGLGGLAMPGGRRRRG